MSRTTVYLIRHAEAEGNVYRRCHGQYDSLLTPRAYLQLPYLAKRFDDIPLDFLYSSPLFRTRMTAQAIADHKNIPVQLRSDLREIHMGDWEDLTWAELPLAYPEEYDAWCHRPWSAAAPNGENVMEAGARMLAEVKSIAAEHMGANIAVTTHGAAIRGALNILHGNPPEGLAAIGWVDNTSVSKIEFDKNFNSKILYHSDASHLPSELSTFAAVNWKNNRAMPESAQIYFRNADLNTESDRNLAIHFMRELYHSAYGSAQTLDTAALLDSMRAAQQVTSRAVAFGIAPETGESVALAYMNATDDSVPNTGMVGGFCIAEAFRGTGFSEQILGQAISVYRQLGKEFLGAYVAQNNERAKGFYRKYAFDQIDMHKNMRGAHNLMRMRIAVD